MCSMPTLWRYQVVGQLADAIGWTWFTAQVMHNLLLLA